MSRHACSEIASLSAAAYSALSRSTSTAAAPCQSRKSRASFSTSRASSIPRRPSSLVAGTRSAAGGCLMALGLVDGFHQDKGAGERDKGGEVLCRLLAAQGDAFEALDLA